MMKANLKTVGAVMAAVIVAVAILFSIIRTFRYVSNTATIVTVEQVSPAVSCAKMVTNSGAALSCWKN